MTLAVPFVNPEELAVMVVDPIAAPWMVKVAVVLPPATGVLAGMVTMPPGDWDRPTVIPPGGAGALRVIVPFIVFVIPSEDESTLRVITGVFTFTVAVPGVRGDPNAVIVAVPKPTGVTVMFAPVFP